MTLWAKFVRMADLSINWLETLRVMNYFWCICIPKLMVYSFSKFLACVRVYCILCNLLLLFYYLTFQETIKNQFKGNYRGMMINNTCNNSPVISWQSVLLVDETGAPGETNQATSHWQIYHIILYRDWNSLWASGDRHRFQLPCDHDHDGTEG
jgi:hypothetical protein